MSADLQQLQGAWKTVALYHRSEEVSREQFPMVRLEFRGDRVTVYPNAGAKRVLEVRLGAQGLTKVMRLMSADQRGPAPPPQYVYELDGDRLRLGMTTRTDLPIPSDPDPRATANMDVIELRRVPEEKAAPAPADREAGGRPVVRGLITQIDPADKTLVVLSVGIEHGIEEGQPLQVYRETPEPKYLGTVQVVSAQRQTSVGRITWSPSPGRGVRVNDRVVSRLNHE